MSDMTEKWYLTEAQKLSRDGELEFDATAKVSVGCDKGAYVQGWVWVPDPDPEEYSYVKWHDWYLESMSYLPAEIENLLTPSQRQRAETWFRQLAFELNTAAGFEIQSDDDLPAGVKVDKQEEAPVD